LIRLAADEDFSGRILRGLLGRQPDLDIARAQEHGLSGADDPIVLDWAASEGRVLLTHDVSTMPDYAYERVRSGQPMPGAFVVRQALPIGRAIDEILLLAECSLDGEWEGQVRYLPL
jgi:hypothetical protein